MMDKVENITIRLSTANAAFEDAPATEIGRILRDLATKVEERGELPAVIYDINGNSCGECLIVREED